VTFSVSSQAATCYYQSNYSKVETISIVKYLAQGHSKQTYGLIFTLALFCAERQAEKL